MRTLKLTIAYIGAGFGGWQSQRGHQAKLPTIQDAVQHALTRVTGERIGVTASGRTDAGVHAIGQVVHIRMRASMPAERLQLALNSVLPPAISIMRVEDVGEAFHARYTTVSKRYRYRIVMGHVISPFDRPYAWHVRVPLNVALMRRELRAFAGSHDFRAFARAHSRPVQDYRRKILRATLTRRGTELTIDLDGTGFLHTMVRSIVGTVVDVGRGRLPAGTSKKLLASRSRVDAGRTAPAQGLCLMEVRYKPVDRVGVFS